MTSGDLHVTRAAAGRVGAAVRHLRGDSAAIAAWARAGLEQRFRDVAAASDPDGHLTDAELRVVVDQLRSAHFRSLQLASARARRRNRRSVVAGSTSAKGAR